MKGKSILLLLGFILLLPILYLLWIGSRGKSEPTISTESQTMWHPSQMQSDSEIRALSTPTSQDLARMNPILGPETVYNVNVEAPKQTGITGEEMQDIIETMVNLTNDMDPVTNAVNEDKDKNKAGAGSRKKKSFKVKDPTVGAIPSAKKETFVSRTGGGELNTWIGGR